MILRTEGRGVVLRPNGLKSTNKAFLFLFLFYYQRNGWSATVRRYYRRGWGLGPWRFHQPEQRSFHRERYGWESHQGRQESQRRRVPCCNQSLCPGQKTVGGSLRRERVRCFRLRGSVWERGWESSLLRAVRVHQHRAARTETRHRGRHLEAVQSRVLMSR